MPTGNEVSMLKLTLFNLMKANKHQILAENEDVFLKKLY